MFCFRVAALFLLIGIAVGAYAPYYDLADAGHHFNDFIQKYNKKYENLEETRQRFEIFKKNLKKFNEWNNLHKHENGGYMITQFADQEGHRSCVDLSSMSNMTKKIQLSEELIRNAPDKVDYREQNLVTEVKDQGDCGSCYIFSAIGNIEGMHAKQSGQLLSLSEQQALDCASEWGCNGGWPLHVMNTLASQGCEGEDDYPYQAEQSTCRADPTKIKIQITGGHLIDTPGVNELKAALASNGAPLSVLMFASEEFMAYIGSDVINPSDCPGTLEINHAVLLVGYNADPNSGKPPHWIIKNSWGTGHGDKGYYYLDFKTDCAFGVVKTCTATVA